VAVQLDFGGAVAKLLVLDDDAVLQLLGRRVGVHWTVGEAIRHQHVAEKLLQKTSDPVLISREKTTGDKREVKKTLKLAAMTSCCESVQWFSMERMRGYSDAINAWSRITASTSRNLILDVSVCPVTRQTQTSLF
jgi:hypothetical protein